MPYSRPQALYLAITLLALLTLASIINLWLAHRYNTPQLRANVKKAPTVLTKNSGIEWPMTPPEEDWPAPSKLIVKRLGILEFDAVHGFQYFNAHLAFAYQSGWPLKTLEHHQAVKLIHHGSITNYPDDGSTNARYLPAGLFLNPLIYALPIWTAFALFPVTKRALTRRSRLRNNRCLNCAYDITNLSQCPECGHPTPEPIHAR